jgi:hypothetical protein
MAIRTAAPAAKAKGSTALVKREEKWQNYAAEAKKVTGTLGGDFVGTAGGILKINKQPLPENTLTGIAVAVCFENGLYEGKFDPENPTPPICFALGFDEEEMTPHKDSEEPQNLDEKTGKPLGCASCEWNVMGSADTGKGKMCKNGRRVGFIAEDAIEGDVMQAKVHYLKIPPTSLVAWDGYVANTLADTLHRPPFAVITAIKAAPRDGGGFTLTPELKGRIEDIDGVTDETLDALEQKHEQTLKLITFPYQPMAKEDREAARRPKAKPAGPRRFTRPTAAAATTKTAAKPATPKFRR